MISSALLLITKYWRPAAIAAALAGIWLWHSYKVSQSYKAGYAAAVAAQIEASAKDRANADKAVNLKSFVECHRRQNAGEKVIWDREGQTCAKLP